jgi:hypothetical protein
MRVGRSRRNADPEWWRADRPEPVPAGNKWIRDEIAAFDASTLPPTKWPGHYPSVYFYEATVSGIDLLLDELHLNAAWSEFIGCTFRQKTAPLSLQGFPAQGSFGSRPSIYRDCDFVGIRFKNAGRFSTGAARFENCRFTRCRFNGHFAYESDFVDCTFTGKVDGCVFGGCTPPSGPYGQPGRRNVITGNDFTGARLTDNIGWRYGFDLDAQRWPDGYVPTKEPEFG